MAEINKILEAEKNIQDIAAELQKMRNAANLLDNTKETTNAILKSTQDLMEQVKIFSSNCESIIKKLSTMDINQFDQKLGELLTISNNINQNISDIKSTLGKAEDKIVGYLEKILSNLQNISVDINKKISDIQSTLGNMENKFTEDLQILKKRQSTLIKLVIALLVMILILLVKSFL